MILWILKRFLAVHISAIMDPTVGKAKVNSKRRDDKNWLNFQWPTTLPPISAFMRLDLVRFTLKLLFFYF